MLRSDVVAAVKDGKFHVYPVRTIDEGIEILTGVEAGTPEADGGYPEGTVHGLVDRELQRLAKGLAGLRRPRREGREPAGGIEVAKRETSRPASFFSRLTSAVRRYRHRPGLSSSRVRPAKSVRTRPDDRESHRLEELPDLPLPALVDLHLQGRVPVAAAEDLDPGRGRSAPLEEDAVPDLVEVLLAGLALDPDLVDLGHAVARVGQPEGQLAVVGEEQGPFRVEVEPPDRIDAGREVLEQVQHGRPPERVFDADDAAGRLVEEDVERPLLLAADRLSVHLGPVLAGIDLLAELEDDLGR